jgi:sigma-B regulation protein RsbQ
MDIGRRNNTTVTGNPQGRPVVLAHGFGCVASVFASPG